MTSKYRLIENYRGTKNFVNNFFQFISVIFPSISFSDWYEKGFWTDKYIPFSLMCDDRIVSSASIALMDIIINDKKYKAVQLGGVGTLPEYRNQGLSRQLMEHILDRYTEKVDFFFLYANDMVLHFYPKFGFRNVKENIFISESIPLIEKSGVRKLNITKSEDYSLLLNLLHNRKPVTKIFGAEDYTFITMWHILNLYREDIFYLEEENVIVVKKEAGDTLHILEIFFTELFELEKALPKLIESDLIKQIKFYLPPDQLNYQFQKRVEEDTGLFILGNIDLLNKHFRFPTTAIT